MRSPPGKRLVAGFVGVAVAAVFTVAGLTLWRTKHAVGQLAAGRQQGTTDARSRLHTIRTPAGRGPIHILQRCWPCNLARL